MEFVDTHCHLHFDNYDDDRLEVLANSQAAGVAKMICVGCSVADSERAVKFAAEHDGVWASAGAHPHDGADFLSDENAGTKISELLGHPKVVAVGEIGLDYFHQNSSKVDQEKTLRSQLEIGAHTELPFIFHVREAWKDFWKIIDEFKNLHGVVHSFSTHQAQLDEILARDFYVGLNGIMTFTKDERQLEAAKAVPLDRLLLETDAPFLTPKPHRGKRCKPKHVIDTAEFLAELRGEDLSKLAAATTKNAEELFGI